LTFKGAAVFGLGHRLSNHKTTRYARNFGRAMGPPGYAYARSRTAIVLQKLRKRLRPMLRSGDIRLLFTSFSRDLLPRPVALSRMRATVTRKCRVAIFMLE